MNNQKSELGIAIFLGIVSLVLLIGGILKMFRV